MWFVLYYIRLHAGLIFFGYIGRIADDETGAGRRIDFEKIGLANALHIHGAYAYADVPHNLIVGIARNISKQPVFSLDERLDLVEELVGEVRDAATREALEEDPKENAKESEAG